MLGPGLSPIKMRVGSGEQEPGCIRNSCGGKGYVVQ
jgi:hypothetical protein